MSMKTTILAAAAVLATAGNALAVTELQLDINKVEAQAKRANGNNGWSGLTHTGSIQLSKGVNTTLAGVLIDGVVQATTTMTVTAFTGVINLVNGGVTGGNFSLLMSDGSTFNTDIVGGSGMVVNQVLPGGVQGFSIDGLTFNGLFNSNTFVGVDVSPWFDTQPLDGSFINFAFAPNSMGRSTSDIDIFLPTGDEPPVIPTPLAAGMGLVGLAGLAARRRR